LPFLAVAIAAMFSDLLRRVPRFCAPLLLIFVASGVLTSSWRLRNDATLFQTEVRPVFEAVERLVKQHPRVLLFVRERRPQMFERLSLSSVDMGTDRIIVARDLGQRNQALIRLYPTYSVFYATEGAEEGVVLESSSRRP
jgi:hypothetical protein